VNKIIDCDKRKYDKLQINNFVLYNYIIIIMTMHVTV